MTTHQCACLDHDSATAKEAIRKSRCIVELVDESHFMVSIRQCGRCGQHFLTLFCERVDWTDGDDPQKWLAVPVAKDEVQRLRTANVAANENVILEIVANERRFLYHDMPKGEPAKLEWKNRTLFIPAHD